MTTTLKNMNVANIHDLEYMALYDGSKSLDALTRLTLLPLDRKHYRPKELNSMIIFEVTITYNILYHSKSRNVLDL